MWIQQQPKTFVRLILLRETEATTDEKRLQPRLTFPFHLSEFLLLNLPVTFDHHSRAVRVIVCLHWTYALLFGRSRCVHFRMVFHIIFDLLFVVYYHSWLYMMFTIDNVFLVIKWIIFYCWLRILAIVQVILWLEYWIRDGHHRSAFICLLYFFLVNIEEIWVSDICDFPESFRFDYFVWNHFDFADVKKLLIISLGWSQKKDLTCRIACLGICFAIMEGFVLISLPQ